MGWLIVLLVLAMAVGSVAMLRPSPVERRQMALRQQAMAQGLTVRVKSLQVPGEAAPRSLAVYALQRSQAEREAAARNPAHWLAVRAPGGGLDQISAGWQFLESDAAARRLQDRIAPLVEGLSGEILAVTAHPAAVGVYWNEAGRELDTAAVAALLKEVKDLPAPDA